MDLIEARLAAGLESSDLTGDLDGAAKSIIDHLPEQEKAALIRSGKIFVSEHGDREFPRGSELEREVYWSAFYRGFDKGSICSWSSGRLKAYVEASIFADKLNTLLRARGVDTGSPAFAHTDLVVALVRAAAGLPSNNSFKPTPLRGAA
ncbi:hypothetical protein J2X02_003809 [Pseudoxanthomonas japonensis]|uniref:hypothetical protein n=1 Tax=Pseudoxanthomonas japonensis TaxID=69284 RepID=UPI002863CCF8|nr:hypothetical protein [Pseudoxanthomonas japonensis]MDR7070937.1 hypothetical protein [Pseudoxanthomonas japonensis]